MITKEKQQLLEYYEQGLNSYKLRDWEKAIENFQKALKIDPNDGPSKEYLKRSKEYKEVPPPEDWDGVYVMKTK